MTTIGDCKYQQELAEIKQFHREIIDRLARMETKQDSIAEAHAANQKALSHLYTITTTQGKELAALDRDMKNLQWLSGAVAGIVAGTVQFLSFVWKRG